MSTDVWEDEHGLSLTRYCGPGTKPGPHRRRWQLSFGPAYQSYACDELWDLAESLSSLARAIRQEYVDTVHAEYQAAIRS